MPDVPVAQLARNEATRATPRQRAQEIGRLDAALRGCMDSMGPQSDPARATAEFRGADSGETLANLQAAHDRLAAYRSVSIECNDEARLGADPLDMLDGVHTDPSRDGDALGNAISASIEAAIRDGVDLGAATRAHGIGFQMDVPASPRILAAALTRSAGAPAESVRSGRVVERGYAPLTVSELLGGPIGTAQAAYKYLEEDAPIPVAGKQGVVASEALDASAPRAENAALAESTLTWREVSVPVESIGTFLPVTEESLEDSMDITSQISGRLMRGVMQAKERQLISGNGTSPNLKGLLGFAETTTSATTRHRTMGKVEMAAVSTSDDDAKKLAAIEAALWDAIDLVAARGGGEPDGILINRTALNRLFKAKDGDGNWRYERDMMGNLATNPWGPMVASTRYGLADYADGNTVAIVGDWMQADEVMRHDLRVEFGMTGDDFKNLRQSVRAYVRCALAVYRPRSFAQVVVAT